MLKIVLNWSALVSSWLMGPAILMAGDRLND